MHDSQPGTCVARRDGDIKPVRANTHDANAALADQTGACPAPQSHGIAEPCGCGDRIAAARQDTIMEGLPGDGEPLPLPIDKLEGVDRPRP